MFKDNLNDEAAWTSQSYSSANPPLPLFRPIIPAQHYPLDALGSTLADAAKAMKHAIQAPDALIGQSILGAAALAVQGHADVKIDGRVCPTSLFLLTVGVSGERKSAVDSEALFSHREFEKEKIAQYENEIHDFEVQKQTYESLKKAILSKKKLNKNQMEHELRSLGIPPQPPYSEIMLVEEPTYEGLVKALENGRPSVGIFSDEGGRMVGGHGMNQDNQLKTATGLCGLWDGKPISRTRSTDGNTKLYGKRTALHLMMQPRVAELLTGNSMLMDQGILSRCLISAPESTVGTRIYKSENLAENISITRYRRSMREILEQSLCIRKGTNEINARTLELSSSDKNLWIAFHNYIESNICDGGKFLSIQGFACKAAEQVLRISAVLTLFENIRANEIDRTHLESAIQLAEFYLSEASRLHHIAAIDPDLLLAQKLSTWCQKYKEVYLVQIYQFGPNAIRDKDVAKKIVGILEKHGHLFKIEGGKVLEGKKRQDVWAVIK